MVNLPVGEPLETRIEEPDGSLEAVAEVSSVEDLETIAARWPECLTAWAALGEDALQAGESVHAYAFFRVGYHRGLDRIRKAGWRGTGTTPWAHEPNRGFLRCVKGLGAAAAAIGEDAEAVRCRDFFRQLAPDAPDT